MKVEIQIISVEKATDKAVLAKVAGTEKNNVTGEITGCSFKIWLPLSQCFFPEDREVCIAPAWLIEKKEQEICNEFENNYLYISTVAA